MFSVAIRFPIQCASSVSPTSPSHLQVSHTMAVVNLLFALSVALTTAALPSPSPAPVDARDLISIPDALTTAPWYGAPENNFSCSSTTHPNPVVLLHGLSADDQVDLNLLQIYLNKLDFCTFSLTYGAHTLAPWIGGLKPLADSAVEIADFVREVLDKTGASKVDLVGHSEGGVQALYVPRSQPGISDVVEHLVALGPAMHGAEYYGFTDLWYIGGNVTRDAVALVLKTVGCAGCDDLAVGGETTKELNDGNPVVQPGNKATIIMSTNDKLVPPEKSIVDEEGVRNILVQDTCPEDQLGHAGLAWDTGVWGLIVNALTEDYDAPVTCDTGLTF